MRTRQLLTAPVDVQLAGETVLVAGNPDRRINVWGIAVQGPGTYSFELRSNSERRLGPRLWGGRSVASEPLDSLLIDQWGYSFIVTLPAVSEWRSVPQPLPPGGVFNVYATPPIAGTNAVPGLGFGPSFGPTPLPGETLTLDSVVLEFSLEWLSPDPDQLPPVASAYGPFYAYLEELVPATVWAVLTPFPDPALVYDGNIDADPPDYTAKGDWNQLASDSIDNSLLVTPVSMSLATAPFVTLMEDDLYDGRLNLALVGPLGPFGQPYGGRGPNLVDGSPVLKMTWSGFTGDVRATAQFVDFARNRPLFSCNQGDDLRFFTTAKAVGDRVPNAIYDAKGFITYSFEGVR